MMKKVFAFILVFLMPCVFGEPKKLPEAEIERCIKQIENFFDNLSTFRADFVEVSSRGWQSIGGIVLKKRPAMLKMDYINPPRRIVLMKKNKVIYYDKELKEKTVTSVYSSPFAFFLDSKLNIHENLEITSCLEDEGELFVAFRKKEDEEEEKGVVVLVFSRKPFNLVRWEIYRKSSQINLETPTRVYLENQKINQYVSDAEFAAYD